MLKGFLESVDAEPLMQCLLYPRHSVKENYDYFICATIEVGRRFSKHNRKEGTKSGWQSQGKLSREKRGRRKLPKALRYRVQTERGVESGEVESSGILEAMLILTILP